MKTKKTTSSGSFYLIRILLLFIIACLTLLFPDSVRADITQESLNSSNGVHLQGTETISYLYNSYSTKLNMPYSRYGDYKVNISVSFNDPSHIPENLPENIYYYIDSARTTLYNKGSKTYTDSRTFYNIRPSELELTFPLDSDDEWDSIIAEYNFTLDFTIQEIPKPTSTPAPTVKPQPTVAARPKVSLEPNRINPLYPGNNDTLSINISDPELSYWKYVQPEQVSVKFSDPSIVSLTKKDFYGTTLLLHIRAQKAGTTQCSVTYKDITAKQNITVAKTAFYVPSSASITLKQKKHISNYVFQMGTGKCSIKNVKSSKKKCNFCFRQKTDCQKARQSNGHLYSERQTKINPFHSAEACSETQPG